MRPMGVVHEIQRGVARRVALGLAGAEFLGGCVELEGRGGNADGEWGCEPRVCGLGTVWRK